jgi:hypothetical protein
MPAIFDWLMTSFSFQGISDRVAQSYIDAHGNASCSAINQGLTLRPPCPLLKNFWSYDGCRYDKLSGCCSEPEHVSSCPVPSHRLRNGRLNQTAYSLFFFMRDIAKNDFAAWLDNRIAETAGQYSGHAHFQEALVVPMRGIYGVSDKVLTMSLSGLLLASDRPDWFALGAGTAVIDTLVHNFLHRTGILANCNADHAYGPACYQPGRCADLIRDASALIDTRQFNPAFPATFTRFVQHAVWRYCALDGLDICNGNQIDDRQSCQNRACHLYRNCRKIRLKN